MSRTTTIEWTEHTVNFWVGCNRVSKGCEHCYAERMSARLQGFGIPAYQGVVRSTSQGPKWTGKLGRSSEDVRYKPLRIRQPSLIFCNSMSDFWHPEAPDEWRLEAFEVMREAHWHQYQLLTKRPENVVPMLERMKATVPVNAWIGATVEDHRVVDRIDILREVPAAIRYISVEPMTAPLRKVDLAGIHWVILGGESGPGARPMRAEWAREVRDQCIAQGVPLFFKQWGHWRNNPIVHPIYNYDLRAHGETYVKKHDPEGKGGSMLDGRRWTEFPDYQRLAA